MHRRPCYLDAPAGRVADESAKVVGPTVRRAVSRAIYTEINARLQLQAVTLGGPITFIAPEEAALMEKGRDAAQEGHGANRTWDMWKDEALRAAKDR
jgi:HCOMODA/2-hydroxy-3-carboxy-muconic semialdehyde decarboxylase